MENMIFRNVHHILLYCTALVPEDGVLRSYHHESLGSKIDFFYLIIAFLESTQDT
jgi:hypothetical protein